jgi:hypothetical protein
MPLLKECILAAGLETERIGKDRKKMRKDGMAGKLHLFQMPPFALCIEFVKLKFTKNLLKLYSEVAAVLLSITY